MLQQTMVRILTAPMDTFAIYCWTEAKIQLTECWDFANRVLVPQIAAVLTLCWLKAFPIRNR